MSIQEDKLKGIANATRKKTGKTALIDGNNLETEILSIPTLADNTIKKYKGPFMVTPSDHMQTIQVEKKYSEANISVVGDENLKAENIVKGVTIFGITGTYECKFPYDTLEFLEVKDGSYIDTNFNPNPTTTKIEYDFLINKYSGNWEALFGGRYRSNVQSYMTVWLDNNNNFSILWYGNYGTQYTPFQLNTRYKFECSLNKVVINGKPIVGSGQKYNDYLSFTILLGRCSERGIPSAEYSNQKIYNCKIWDNGKLVRDMIPCIVNATQEKGMWDIIENKFYPLIGA